MGLFRFAVGTCVSCTADSSHVACSHSCNVHLLTGMTMTTLSFQHGVLALFKADIQQQLLQRCEAALQSATSRPCHGLAAWELTQVCYETQAHEGNSLPIIWFHLWRAISRLLWTAEFP